MTSCKYCMLLAVDHRHCNSMGGAKPPDNVFDDTIFDGTVFDGP